MRRDQHVFDQNIAYSCEFDPLFTNTLLIAARLTRFLNKIIAYSCEIDIVDQSIVYCCEIGIFLTQTLLIDMRLACL